MISRRMMGAYNSFARIDETLRGRPCNPAFVNPQGMERFDDDARSQGCNTNRLLGNEHLDPFTCQTRTSNEPVSVTAVKR